MPGSSVSASAEDSVLPVIPTSLVEVDVVEQRREGVPTAVSVPDVDGAADLAAAAAAFGVDTALLEAVGAKSSAGEVCTVPLADGAFGWTVGSGSGEPVRWRQVGAGLARAIRERLGEGGGGGSAPEDLGDALDSEYVQVRLPDGVDADTVAALTLGLSLGGYRFRVTATPTPPRLRKALLVAPEGADVAALREAVGRARQWASATALARDLANAPSNVKDPEWFTTTAAQLARAVPGLEAVVRDEKWLADRGFGGILAVGGGSARPPRLLELSWNPDPQDSGADPSSPHIVLVGKGITFDTGGISIKPAEGMELMRTDMAGGGAVIGAMLSIARSGLPVRVTALVPSAENHVSGSAYRPGDIVRHYGGTTTEVGNTDAEGRMVMADALAYAVRRHEPDMLVDVATLTGAMKVALGLRTGGVLSTDARLGERVRAAGDRAGEAWWPMPLLDDHAEDVRSDIADVRQTPPGPGGVTAGLFLREFTSGLPWAHLDIAGPARADKPHAEVVAGATGFAARTLVEFVAGFAE
ncbi:leucyl aminopeptidase [Halopolyspora algeriensis]|uniref:Probable cytosol aminopeptidase n=1 Tax=Halopolyspora algeriensis TaxID=1500506 RepID=A0A368VMN1_9ACTN|nr:leucyl aminopeptidase [Halopolyspora algeriensis]RCW42788.1 leucyl aminopeptidase [Halopolyspora algeriensis]TQM56742.1 leucyl aminopeptidase [Halopolyspora algeriensis]